MNNMFIKLMLLKMVVSPEAIGDNEQSLVKNKVSCVWNEEICFWDVAVYNTFGFEYLGIESNKFIFAYIKSNEKEDIQDMIPNIKIETGSKSLSYDEWLLRPYLEIDGDEYHLIIPILNYLLDKGKHFIVSRDARLEFGPKDIIFTWELFELKMIKHISDIYEFTVKNNKSSVNTLILKKYANPWIWPTLRGEKFSSEVAKMLEIEQIQYNDKNNFWNWPKLNKFNKSMLYLNN